MRWSARWSRSGGGSRRCSTKGPTGWTAPRAPGSRARSPRSAGAPRRLRPGCRCSRGSAARPRPISSTGSRSTASRGASTISGCTATGSIRPGRSPKPCSSKRTACSSPRRRCAAAARMAMKAGTWPRRAPAQTICCAARAASRRRHRSIMPSQAEVLIVTDVKRGDMGALANAYARLGVASGGGMLGLFTAIRRLRGVHARIADRLAREGLPLYAQHVDPIDTGTLVDIFRDDPAASFARHRCLARRSRCAGTLAAARRAGGRAVAQADRAPRRAAAGGRAAARMTIASCARAWRRHSGG